MKVFLMYRDRDFDMEQEPPWQEEALTQDLELQTLFNAMALGDSFLFRAARRAVLSGLNTDRSVQLYRQAILKDCLSNPDTVREIFRIAVEAIENKRKHWLGIFSDYPSAILHSSVDFMQMFMNMLRELRHIADEQAGRFESEGFMRLFATLRQELDDAFFTTVQEHLTELSFPDGVLLSAELGKGNNGTHYTLRRRQEGTLNWLKKVLPPLALGHSFAIPDSDDAGQRALSVIKDQGLNQAANALARSADHVLSFFTMLKTELAFYVGCLNLSQQLTGIGEPICFPRPDEAGSHRLSFDGLYDVCLTLTVGSKVVGNELAANDKDLVVITGANQGGKSTFLRSVGLAQMMMQCGMFVPAESFCSTVCDGLFTHYRRREDETMTSGKLDEELGRMSAIIDHITPDSIVLFNESFAATNEREGSEIARQIVSALLESGVRVLFVTHQYEFAHSFFEKHADNATFLRAERRADGSRTFKMVEGEPLRTSFGQDLYDRVFGTNDGGPQVSQP